MTLTKKSILFSTLTAIALILTLCFSFSYIKNKELINQETEILVPAGKLIKKNTQTGVNDTILLKAFYLDKYLTTVAEFDEFVKETGYKTDAEKFGNSIVLVNGNWELVNGANYLYPFGTNNVKAKLNHPVTQVSWNDAVEYAKWKGKRLPTEAEWEYAATNGGIDYTEFPWGNELVLNGKYLANVWEGSFPYQNTTLDRFEYTSPVKSFPATLLGFYDMGGNVWQWCSDEVEPTAQEALQDTSLRRVTKGASFLTDITLDPNARTFGHSSTTPETGICHTGFRLARNTK